MTAPVDHTFLAFQEALAGRYSLERELGRGGMGIVYLAREVRLDRPVAIKLLPPEFAANPTLRARFLREVRVSAKLSHPNIVPIFAVDEAGDFVFYVMAYVDGETLAERVRRDGPLRPAVASRILREVAWGLAYAHALGIVHRDVKPANIMLERGSERALVLDFGIARLANASGETGVGEVMGTPEYMSPEQACGEAVDGRSDLYSLGIVGHYMLTGTLPFSGGSREVLAKQVTQLPAPVSALARGTPQALSTAIDRCLAKNPAERFPTGEALAEALAVSLEKRTDVPVPLRVFLDRRRAAVMVMPIAFGFPALMSGLEAISRGTAGSGAYAVVIGGAAAMLFGPIAVIAARLRRLMKQGYGPEDVGAALRTLGERRREEFLYEFGTHAGLREWIVRGLAATGLVVGIGSGLLLLTPILPEASRSRDVLAAFAVMGTYLGGIAAIFASRWRTLREGRDPRLARLWQGPVGRFLGRLAGRNLKRVAPPPDRPTELGIAMSAEALFASFPRDQRKQLGDVPGVLHNLEAHARTMRVRMSELDASIQEAQQSPTRSAASPHQEKLLSDLRAARAAAEQRLSDVVTALETLRLDLLRMRAGAGTTDTITQDLASARALGQDVDRLLDSQREVDNDLRVRG